VHQEDLAVVRAGLRGERAEQLAIADLKSPKRTTKASGSRFNSATSPLKRDSSSALYGVSPSAPNAKSAADENSAPDRALPGARHSATAPDFR